MNWLKAILFFISMSTIIGLNTADKLSNVMATILALLIIVVPVSIKLLFIPKKKHYEHF